MTQNNSNPGEKTFTLKDIEIRLIGNINERHNAELADMLSFIAIERLAYDVTPNTQFRVDENRNLYISEREDAPKEEEVATA